MPGARYRDWFDAIRNKRRVCYIYEGKPREGCPHVLGLDKDGAEKVLVYRVVPGGSQPQWRCLFVAKTAIRLGRSEKAARGGEKGERQKQREKEKAPHALACRAF